MGEAGSEGRGGRGGRGPSLSPSKQNSCISIFKQCSANTLHVLRHSAQQHAHRLQRVYWTSMHTFCFWRGPVCTHCIELGAYGLEVEELDAGAGADEEGGDRVDVLAEGP
eukprot:2803544-Rhodomonas_salina.1